MFVPTSRHSMAYVNHNNGTKVVVASTTEFCLARYLYKTSDVSAAYHVGRLVALRCKETGLYRVMWDHKRYRKVEHKRVSMSCGTLNIETRFCMKCALWDGHRGNKHIDNHCSPILLLPSIKMVTVGPHQMNPLGPI